MPVLALEDRVDELYAYGVALAMSTGVLDGSDEKIQMYLRSCREMREGKSTNEEVQIVEECFQLLWTKYELHPGETPSNKKQPSLRRRGVPYFRA